MRIPESRSYSAWGCATNMRLHETSGKVIKSHLQVVPERSRYEWSRLVQKSSKDTGSRIVLVHCPHPDLETADALGNGKARFSGDLGKAWTLKMGKIKYK